MVLIFVPFYYFIIIFMDYRKEPKAPEVSAEQGQRLSIAAQRVGLVIEDVIDLLENGGEHLQFLLASIKENKRLAEFEVKVVPVIQKLTALKQQMSIHGKPLFSQSVQDRVCLKTLLTVGDLKKLVDEKQVELSVHSGDNAQAVDFEAKWASVTTADNHDLCFSLNRNGVLVWSIEEPDWNKLNEQES